MNDHCHECPECGDYWDHGDDVCMPSGPEIWPSYATCPDCAPATSTGDAEVAA